MKPILTSYVRLAEIVAVVILAIFAALTYRELSALRKLPVSLPNYEFEVAGGSEPVAQTRGTWMSVGGIPEPLQTTTIECRKATMRCVQSAAVIQFIGEKGLLEATQTEFEVARWSDKEIVTKPVSGSCATLTLTLDLVEKRARSKVSAKPDGSRCQEARDRTLELVAGYRVRNPDAPPATKP